MLVNLKKSYYYDLIDLRIVILTEFLEVHSYLQEIHEVALPPYLLSRNDKRGMINLCG